MMNTETLNATMSASQLAYRFAIAAGYELVGTEDAFALLVNDLADRKYVATYGNVQYAADVCFEEHAAADALEMARELDAVFKIVDGAVQCEVAGVLASDSTYVGAAMKAIVLHRLCADRGQRGNRK